MPLSRKTKARISATISPQLMLVAVLGTGAIVIMVHMLAIVMILAGQSTPWFDNMVWMGPSVAMIAFAIALARRAMAHRGWAAVRAPGLAGLVEIMETRQGNQTLQAALATRVQQQGWLSWSCVFDAIQNHGLADGQIRSLRQEIVCPWGPCHRTDGALATRSHYRRRLDPAAWHHGQMETNTKAIAARPATAPRF